MSFVGQIDLRLPRWLYEPEKGGTSRSESCWPDDRIAEAYGCHPGTVGNVRKRFVLEGLEAALERKPQKALS